MASTLWTTFRLPRLPEELRTAGAPVQNLVHAAARLLDDARRAYVAAVRYRAALRANDPVSAKLQRSAASVYGQCLRADLALFCDTLDVVAEAHAEALRSATVAPDQVWELYGEVQDAGRLPEPLGRALEVLGITGEERKGLLAEVGRMTRAQLPDRPIRGDEAVRMLAKRLRALPLDISLRKLVPTAPGPASPTGLALTPAVSGQATAAGSALALPRETLSGVWSMVTLFFFLLAFAVMRLSDDLPLISLPLLGAIACMASWYRAERAGLT